MSGVKGRSGRKPNFPKLKQAELQDLSKYVLLNALQSQDVTMQDKIRIALVLYPHYIPAKQDITLKAGIPEADRLLLEQYGVGTQALPSPAGDDVVNNGTASEE